MATQTHENHTSRDPWWTFAFVCAAIGLPVLFVGGFVAARYGNQLYDGLGLIALAIVGAGAFIGGLIEYRRMQRGK